MLRFGSLRWLEAGGLIESVATEETPTEREEVDETLESEGLAEEMEGLVV